ncbi:hypothetical protein ENKNEFLB_02579 [Nocardioides aquaticus]|uniref:Probable membrane transporter protein n=1 Tax=Nocardioides aquaticus TaxID=160826 RepID=A0ABX8EI36_9ACTN|nr:sulfite exporter TauE/SafE family protein [Nocardioides aquaticus]QVT80188.1 hypothetical protein ENKNEFLB_02579 [Nocardioides aquaticus]
MLCAVLVGAVVQNLVGLGLGLVAAPVITLVAPELMPDVLLWLATALPLVTLWRDHDDIDWRGLGWTFPTRLVGTVAAVAAVAAISPAALGVLIGLVVLAAVVLTWRAVTVPLNRGTLLGAGLLGGFAGTASSVGGPPLAILYQHSPPQRMRTTLAVYFTTGSAISLLGLGLGGQLSLSHFWVSLAVLPMLFVGTLAGSRLRRRIPLARVRPAVLAVCAASALVLLVRSVVLLTT